MSKVTRVKEELLEVETLNEVLSVMKDISTNRFFIFTQKKRDISKFLENCMVIFNKIEMLETNCPLVHNDNPITDIIIVTSDSSFMTQLNSKVVSLALEEAGKLSNCNIISLGARSNDKFTQEGIPVIKTFDDVEADEGSRAKLAIEVREFCLERLWSGKSGKLICVYMWAKSFGLLKPRAVKFFPLSYVMGSDQSSQKPKVKKVNDIIMESSVEGTMKAIGGIWIISRLYEIFAETICSEAAAQAQQLESAIETLREEQKKLNLSYRKACREAVNKSMAEVMTAVKAIKG